MGIAAINIPNIYTSLSKHTISERFKSFVSNLKTTEALTVLISEQK